MSLIKRVSIVDKAALTCIGNSMIVCGSSTADNKNTSDMITIDGGTTRDYTKAGSKSSLYMIPNSDVLYAELVWYSTVASTAEGATDLRSIQDNPIIFTMTNGDMEDVTPQNTEDYTSSSGSIVRFRSADVTSYIRDYQSGDYSVSSVPTSIPPTGLSDTRCGWSLNVIYRNNEFKPKKIDYMSGIAYAVKDKPYQTIISGFTTSFDADYLKGKLILSAGNGEAIGGTDSIAVGPSLANMKQLGNGVASPNPNPLTAPNNPYNNFFCGAINIADSTNKNFGLININGTNGTNNHDGFVPLQVIGGRNKWDITGVDISNTLIPSQTMMAMQLTTENTSGIQVVSLGTEIEALAPDVIVTLDIYDTHGDGEYAAQLGEALVYTVVVKNQGEVDADNVIVSFNPGMYASIRPNSVRINNIKSEWADITKGINLGTIRAFGISNVSFGVNFDSIPELDPVTNHHSIANNAAYSYEFTSGIDRITNSGVTNSKVVVVEEGNLSIVKSSSVMTPTVGDTIILTNVITNVGTQTATDIFFQDPDTENSTFIPNSVYINDKLTTGINPDLGFKLNDLNIDETVTVSYSVTINPITVCKLMNTESSVQYCYYIHESSNPIYRTSYSNVIELAIQYSRIEKKTCTENNYPKIGNTLTYSTKLTNAGNIDAVNVLVKDTPILGRTFVKGTVTVNGKAISEADPYEGFTLSNPIASSATVEVKYNVLVNSLSPKEKIENSAEIPFKYKVNDEQGVVDDVKISNTVETLSNNVCLNMSEDVNRTCATTGDSIFYTIRISNTGNINSSNCMFYSNIQKDTSFVPGSVMINGIYYTDYNPENGFEINNLCAGSSCEVVFEVTVNNIPDSNILYNTSRLSYSYLPNPSGKTVSSEITSNRAETSLIEASYSINMSVDKQYALPGETLVYSITLNNDGDSELFNINFFDNLPSFLNFIPGTVYINGISYQDYNPKNGFIIDTLHQGDTATIGFGVTVVSSPDFGFILNKAMVNLSYQNCKDTPVKVVTVNSNEVGTYIVNGSMTINKLMSKTISELDDIITYTFDVVNSGNIPLTNVLFEDNLSSSLEFVQGSVVVSGVNKTEYNPIVGFSLGNMNVGQTIRISFDSKVIGIPTPNIISNYATGRYSFLVDPANQPESNTINSNTVTTTINKSNSILTKQVDKNFSVVNDILTYTFTSTNTGTVPLRNVRFLDILQSELEFVTDSVVINGVSKPGYNPNEGFAVDDVMQSGTSTIIFSAKVKSVPSDMNILNAGTISYEYILNPAKGPQSDSRTSNTTTTKINSVEVTNVKSVDKEYATSKDILTYTSIITNKSTISIDNTNFIDIIPSNTMFLAGTVTINNIPYTDYNPQNGFTLGKIEPNKEVSVQFKVQVVENSSIESINNHSNINYGYKIYPDRPDELYENTASNIVTTILKVGMLNIIKYADRTEAKLNDIVTYTIDIENIGTAILHSVFLKDLLQSSSSFISDSLYINGSLQTGLSPLQGFNLPDIDIGSKVKILFKVRVDSIPSLEGKLYNTANVTCSYYVDPEKGPLNLVKDSNTTAVTVSDTIVSCTKQVDKTTAKVNDTLNYTVIVRNQGNATAENVKLIDIFNSNLKFVPQSVYINEVQYSSYDPTKGFSIPNITGQGSVTVKFAVQIISRPVDNIVYNSAKITYSYTLQGVNYDGTMETNITETAVLYGELTVTKSVDKVFGVLNDKLAYTIIVKNTGSIDTTAILFKDIIQSEASLHPSSVTIDGVRFNRYDPNEGFSLSDLSPNKSHIITFMVKIDSIPSSGQIKNTANITFTYRFSSTEIPITVTQDSNTVSTSINVGRLVIKKAVDKSYATINDTLVYSSDVTNNGTVPSSKVVFKNIIANNTEFIAGSVTINGISNPQLNPEIGFDLGRINPADTVKVAYSVKVKSVPSDGILYSSSNVNYEYVSNPSSSPISSSAVSNTVSTTINIGQLRVEKSVDKSYATIKDTINYTINITNTGNVNASRINFRDVIPNGLRFVQGSVTVGGVPYQAYNPYDSFALGVLLPGESVRVSFSTEVISVPSPNTVNNICNIVFSYYIDPAGAIITSQTDSNTVSTVINSASITLTKSVDKSFATAKDNLTYDFILTNSGNVDLSNVIFIDNLQSDIAFASGSVVVNGVEMPSYNPVSGFNIGTLSTLSSTRISFKVTVIPSPTKNVVLNFASATYSYKINPKGETYTLTSQSNTVSTALVLPSITGSKAVDLTFATMNDVLNYTILIKNTGNYLLSSIQFIDTLSNGGTFVTGSVLINGEKFVEYNPVTGFGLPDLIAGNTVKVQFQTTVSSLPSPPVITNYADASAKCVIQETHRTIDVKARSNEVTTNIIVGSLLAKKTVDKRYGRIQDILTYTNVITNNGNVTASNVFFKDILQNELKFVAGSVRVSSTEYPRLNPSTGFELNNILPGESVTVSFDAAINGMPVPPVINNNSTTTFKYKINPQGVDINGSVTSNSVTTNVVRGEITAAKTVDKPIATVGDELTYRITLTNTGNVVVNNIVFTDTPSTGTVFKPGSVVINTVSHPLFDPTVGFNIPTIAVGGVATIILKASVTSVPSSNNVTNTAQATFAYLVDPAQMPYTATVLSNTVTTNIALSKLEVTKAVDKNYATAGDKLTYTITIKNVGNLNATNVIFLDPIPENTTFVNESVKVNGTGFASYNPNVGFDLNTIAPGQTVIVVYMVQIDNPCEI